ncbi:Ribokinase [Holothuria leucospilota]|uniref:Ribokinase n=1 Tax=Holothuria leucospilota TaxID=206669 RepID=A0A9Q1CFV6_HOLLE|nr:Ribokinase [Holothuria leucospilota]
MIHFFIFTFNAGQNAFISVRGANESLTPTDVEEVFSKVTSAKVMSTEMFIRTDTCLSALRAAKKRGWHTVLNPSPAISNLDPEFFSVSDCICLNQLETRLLTGLSVTNVEEAKKASLVLMERGCQKVIITLGKDGAVLVTVEERKPQHIPVTPVTALDTTGAGDCFLGTLAYYLASFPSLSLKEMVHRSNQIASLSVQSPGAQLSYPWYKDLPKELLT